MEIKTEAEEERAVSNIIILIAGFLFGSALRHFAEKIEMSERTTSKSAQCPKVL
jgi:hypothetical protein